VREIERKNKRHEEKQMHILFCFPLAAQYQPQDAIFHILANRKQKNNFRIHSCVDVVVARLLHSLIIFCFLFVGWNKTFSAFFISLHTTVSKADDDKEEK